MPRHLVVGHVMVGHVVVGHVVVGHVVVGKAFDSCLKHHEIFRG